MMTGGPKRAAADLHSLCSARRNMALLHLRKCAARLQEQSFPKRGAGAQEWSLRDFPTKPVSFIIVPRVMALKLSL